MKSKFLWIAHTLLLLITILLTLSSCRKFLDKKQNSKLVVPSTLTDLQALIDNGIINFQSTPCYGEVSADDYFLKEDTYLALDEGNQKRYTWRYFFFGTGNDWSACYQAVYNSNLVLDLIKDIPESAKNKEQKERIKAEAQFSRSYHFLQLLWNHAKAYDKVTADEDWGIALRLTSDFNVPSVRASNRESYNRVIADTKAAIPFLPTYPLVLTRPGKAAAYGLLARCYFSMGDYSQSALYADSCLQINGQLIDFNNDEDTNDDLSSMPAFKEFNKEVIYYTEMNTFFYIHITLAISRMDTTLYGLYDDNDLRKVAYFSSNNDGYKSYKGSYASDYNMFFTGIATDEMYLTRGESLVRIGEVQKGLDDLNTLLSKRYASGTYEPLTGLAQEEALEIFLKERRKELVMRGLRWVDLKRLNKGGANITLKRKVGLEEYSLEPNAGFYALPIPEDIIMITGMPQNDL